MKNFLQLIITFCTLIILTLDIFAQNQPVFTSNPPNFRYCDGEQGLQLGVTNTVAGTTYHLQQKNGSWVTKDSKKGDGKTVWFDGVWKIGTYRYMVEDPFYTSNERYVRKDNYPLDTFKITGGGGYCAGITDSIEIGLNGSEKSVNYFLYRNGSLLNNTNEPGTGQPISFGFFSIPGTYTVRGKRFNCSSYMKDSVSITVFSNPTANFSASPQNQCANDPVVFTNQSKANQAEAAIVSWLWDFGDPNSGSRNSSTLQNPIHVFEAWGNGSQTFDVKLLVTDSNGCEAEIIKEVTVQQKPDATLSASGDGIKTTMVNDTTTFAFCGSVTFATFTFTNQSTTPSINTLYHIDWGDDSPAFNSPEFNEPIYHEYSGLGFKTLTYTVSQENGCNHIKKYYIFIGSTPSGGIGNPGNASGNVPFYLEFPIAEETYDNTLGTTYVFDFGDGTDPVYFTQSTLPADKKIAHYYTKCSDEWNYCLFPWEGRYTFKASCVASNPCDNAYSIACPIYVSCPVIPGFGVGLGWGAGQGEIMACNPVTFTNETIPGFYITGNGTTFTQNTVYSWDFGDPESGENNFSSDPNPTHTFTNSCESYTVTLIAWTGENSINNSGIDTIQKLVYIQEMPTANFDMDFTSNCVPKEVEMNNTSDIGCFGVPEYLWTVQPENDWQIITPEHEGDNTYINPVFQFNVSGTYSVTLTITNSCGSDTITKSILVCQRPEVEIKGDSIFLCVGKNFTIQPDSVSYNDNFSPITQYQWTSDPLGPIFNTNNPAYPTITFNDVGIYNITVVATNECGQSEPATLQFDVSPGIENDSIRYYGNMQLCANMKLSEVLTGTNENSTPPLTGGDGTYTYTWQIDEGSGWTEINDENSPDLDYDSTLTVNPTKFRRIVKSAGCESVSNELSFTVRSAITNNSIQPTVQHICSGETPGTLMGSDPAGGGGTFEYLWEQSTDCSDPESWGPANGEPNNKTFSPPELFVTICYRRIVYSVEGLCEDISEIVTVNVYGDIENDSIYHPDPVICEGEPAGTIYGSDPSQSGHNSSWQYTWQEAVAPNWNWIDVPDVNTKDYLLPQLNHTTRFRRIAKAPAPVPVNCNNNESNVIEFTVNPKPIVNAGDDINAFNGKQVTLNGTASGGSGNYTYWWEPKDLISSGQGTLNPTTVNLYPPPTNFIVFTLTVTDSITGCSSTDNMTVYISGGSLICSVTADKNHICIGESVTLNGSASGGSGSYTYLWSLPEGGSSSGQQIMHTPTNSGSNTYLLEVDDGATTTQCEFIVQVDDLPFVINNSSVIKICSGEQLNYSPEANIPEATFNWYSVPNPYIYGNSAGVGDINDALFNSSNEVQSITYFIQPTGPEPTFCSGTDFELTVLVNPTAQIVNSPTSQTVVSGQSSAEVIFTSNVSGATFQWSSEDNCPEMLSYSTPLNGDVLPSQIIEIDSIGPETCIITFYITPYFDGCQGITYQYNIYVQKQPIQFTVTGGGVICQGGSLNVYLNGSQTGVNYQLYRNGTIPVQPPKAGNGNPIEWSNITKQGIYTVVGINQSNMVQNQMIGQVAVIVNPLPSIFVIVPSGNQCAPVTPLLNGSQAGVRYQLIKDGQSIVDEVDGTGEIGFLQFKEQTEVGIYTINAVNLSSLCERMMDGELIIKPLPLEFPIYSSGILCEGSTICIEGSEIGVNYQLWKNNNPFGAIITGTGDAICFEEQTEPGVYRVYAKNINSLCEIVFEQ